MVLFCHKAHSKAAINPTTPPGLPHRRWLNGTAANQARPSCAASSMPRLDEGIEIDVASAGAAVHSVQSSRRSAVLPFALGTLLPLAAIAIGSRLWQRRRRRAEWQARQQDSETLLTLDLRTRQGSNGSSSDSDQRVEAQMPAARRQRLAALLSKRPGGTIEMLPLGEVQRYALLAHKVASSSAGEANTHYEPAHEADLEAGQPGRLPTAGGDRGGRPRPAWGLPTDSLRLKPSQLEVSCEALVCAAAGVSLCCQLAPICCAAHLFTPNTWPSKWQCVGSPSMPMLRVQQRCARCSFFLHRSLWRTRKGSWLLSARAPRAMCSLPGWTLCKWLSR